MLWPMIASVSARDLDKFGKFTTHILHTRAVIWDWVTLPTLWLKKWLAGLRLQNGQKQHFIMPYVRIGATKCCQMSCESGNCFSKPWTALCGTASGRL